MESPKTVLYSPAAFHLFIPPFLSVAADLKKSNSDIRQVIILNFMDRNFSEGDFKTINEILDSGLFEVYVAYSGASQKGFSSRIERWYVADLSRSIQLDVPVTPGGKPVWLIRPAWPVGLGRKFIPFDGIRWSILDFLKTVVREWRIFKQYIRYQAPAISYIFKFKRWVHRAKAYRGKYTILASFLDKLKPDVAVFGSDQGETINLLQMEILKELNTEIVVLSVCDIEKENKLLRWNHSLSNFFEKLGRFGRFLKAVTWKGNVIGTFDDQSLIFATSAQMVKKLESAGISKDRVKSVALPIVGANEGEINRLKSVLNWKEGDLVVTVFTENLRPLYGFDYDKSFFEGIKPGLDGIIGKGIRVCFKLHPHESAETEALIRKVFGDPRYIVNRDINYLAFVQLSEICVAHFSRVLVEAIQRKKPIISFNILSDTRTFLSGQFKEKFELTRFDNFKARLDNLIFDFDFRKSYLKSIDDLRCELNEGHGKASSEVIVDLLAERKNDANFIH
ncbi:hypothetical protein [Bdellovibrio sp. HCB-110]|uniref:hypothetical protein n=1 Tax=Bdellovibrio sp. HCB-110 TaxID=3391182 RepID=UPI0039B63A97